MTRNVSFVLKANPFMKKIYTLTKRKKLSLLKQFKPRKLRNIQQQQQQQQ